MSMLSVLLQVKHLFVSVALLNAYLRASTKNFNQTSTVVSILSLK